MQRGHEPSRTSCWCWNATALLARICSIKSCGALATLVLPQQSKLCSSCACRKLPRPTAEHTPCRLSLCMQVWPELRSDRVRPWQGPPLLTDKVVKLLRLLETDRKRCVAEAQAAAAAGRDDAAAAAAAEEWWACMVFVETKVGGSGGAAAGVPCTAGRSDGKGPHTSRTLRQSASVLHIWMQPLH